MASNVFFNALQAIDANGDAVSGAKAYFYDTGTSNLQTVYTDATLSDAHPSPLIADSSGVFAAVFQSGSTDIKVNMTDASDVDLPGYPIDPVTLQSTASGASSIPFSPTPRIVATDVQAAIEEIDGEVEAIEDAHTIENSVYGTSGTTTAYTIAVTDVTAYTTGDRYWVRADATNTAACTINVESVGAKDIKKYDTSDAIVALVAGDFAIGVEYLLHYDGTQFIIISGKRGGEWEFVEDAYDFAVDGAVASFETANFEDGYEYMFSVEGLSMDATPQNLTVELYGETDAAYHATDFLLSEASGASADDLWGWVEFSATRAVSKLKHIKATTKWDLNLDSVTNGGLQVLHSETASDFALFNDVVIFGTAQKITKARFSMPVSNFAAGKMITYRRALA